MGEETTFPLSNFKAKHIFGILMEWVTFLKPYRAPKAPEIWGAVGAPICFSVAQGGVSWRPDRGAPVVPRFFKFHLLVSPFTAAEGGGFPNGGAEGALRWRRRRHSPRGRGKWQPDWGAPVFLIEFYLFLTPFTAAEGGGFPNGRWRCPKGGAKGATPPEGDRNPAEGGNFDPTSILNNEDVKSWRGFKWGFQSLQLCIVTRSR